MAATVESEYCKVKYFANACVGIFTNQFNVLCDPWLVDGAYDGAWFHFPPLQTKPEELTDFSHIYISHIHPDHFCEATLRRLPKKQPVIICKFKQPWLKQRIERLGFSVIEVEPGASFELVPGIRLWMYESFTHNPLVEDAEVPNVIDSAIVIENGNWAVLNANDNPPDEKACRSLRKQFGNFDLAMLPYSGASEYPSCFRNLSMSEKKAGGDRKIESYLNGLEKSVNILEPKLTLPFAGQYILGGKMVDKNRYLGIPPVGKAVQRVTDLGYRAVEAREGDVIDIDTSEVEHTLPPSTGLSQEEYEQQIQGIPYWVDEAFAMDPDHQADLFPLIQSARRRLWDHQNRLNWHRTYRVLIQAEDSPSNCYLFDYGNQEISKVASSAIPEEPYLIIYVTYAKLLALLTRHMNWNNAGIGCLIDFSRSPEYYQSEVFALLPYFQA